MRIAPSEAMTTPYHDATPIAKVADLHRSLCAQLEAAMEAAMLPNTIFALVRTPAERLRIGYVTGDLHRQHPVNIF